MKIRLLSLPSMMLFSLVITGGAGRAARVASASSGEGAPALHPVQEATRSRTDLAFQYNLQPSSVPLTNEKVWGLDPDELNPHRIRWVLQRQTDIVGLDAVKLADGRFGVRALGIAAAAKTYVRAPGPWYRPISEFPCTRTPSDWFATEDGTKKAAEDAGNLWRELMSDRRLDLSIQLDAISASTADIALVLGKHLFQSWLRLLDQEWREQLNQRIRAEEWALYTKLAKSTGACEKPLSSVSWEQMMEPVPADGTPKLIVRAPARRWNGLYSVRLNVVVGTQRVNGQFLLDSSARTSIISPTLLKTQGIVSVLVQTQTASPERVSGALFRRPGLARQGVVDQVEMSGTPLPIREFLIFDTDFFGPPENVASCCDGILGMDFLSRFVVEFSPGPPVEIKLWERADFRAPAEEFLWTELSAETRKGSSAFHGLVSSCELRSGRNSIPGIRWNSGSGAFIQAHLPWAERARFSREWSLQCGDKLIAEEVTPSVPAGAPPGSGLDARDPGMDAGMALLGAGAFVFDLPHGRFWIPKMPSKGVSAKNSSGLLVKYILQKGERVLRVEEIAPKTPAESLAKAGLKPGMVLAQINSRAAEELDQWEVEQILAGTRGDSVSIRWETPAGTKIAPLQLR